MSQSQEQQIKSLQAYIDVLEHKNDELHDKIQKMQEQSESLKRIRAAVKAALMETIALLHHEQTQTTQLTHTACEAEKAEEIL